MQSSAARGFMPCKIVGVVLTAALTLPAMSSAQQRLPRFETTECFPQIRSWASEIGLECGWLIAPELRERPDGPTVRLAVGRLRAKTPNGAPPIVMLHGGPGGVGGVLTSSAQRYIAFSGNGTRDVIVYDQRGAGLSEPKLCRDVAGDTVLAKLPPSQKRWESVARACVASMRASGMEPAAYTSIANAADLADLRRALGYDIWNVYGASYGGRLVFEAMRRDPHGIRAAIAESPAIPAVVAMTEDPLAVQGAFERVFASCAAQPTCSAAFPTLAQDFYAVYDSLSKSPFEVRLNRADNAPVHFDARAYLTSMRCQLTNPRTIPRIPLLVRELQRGDRMKAAQVLADDCLGAKGCFVEGCTVAANPVNPLIGCYDGYGKAYWTARDSVAREVKPIFRTFEEGGRECEIWQQRFADPSDLLPLRSDIPTLLLNGEFDERTPADHARRGASRLAHAYLYEIPGESHAIRSSDCRTSIITQFLGDPSRAPDASCLASIPKVAFATKDLAVPTLTLLVDGDSLRSKFVGRWEAEFPNAPRQWTVDLKIEGTRVSGMWRPNQLPIAEGTVNGDTLRFKVKTGDGMRIITFTGVLRGDELAFTRDVEVLSNGAPGGSGIFGALGARTFTARRTR
jgi:pimeloyl-ACP methyl ester carboxylesterase